MKITDYPRIKKITPSKSSNVLIAKELNPRDNYLKTIFKHYSLGSRGKAIFIHIIDNYDIIDMSVELSDLRESMQISKPTYYAALIKLLEAKLILRSTKSVHHFFINPDIAPYDNSGKFKNIEVQTKEKAYAKQVPYTYQEFLKYIPGLSKIFIIEKHGDRYLVEWSGALELHYYQHQDKLVDITNNVTHHNNGLFNLLLLFAKIKNR